MISATAALRRLSTSTSTSTSTLRAAAARTGSGSGARTVSSSSRMRMSLSRPLSHPVSVSASSSRWFASAVPVDDGSSDTPSSSSSSGVESSSSTADTVDADADNDKNDLENSLLQNLKPSQVVSELDRHIVGQADAKRAVAIAMRNRWRRKQLPDDLRKEVTPRNVLLVGPTGCGKTEVARRMAQLNDAPFIKVEATKFTEVGYHGRDVDQIIRDLMDISMALTRKVWTDKLRVAARAIAEDRILDLLTGPAAAAKSGSGKDKDKDKDKDGDTAAGTGGDARGRESFRDMLRQGILDDQEIEVDVPQGQPGGGSAEPMGGGDGTNPNLVAMSDLWQKMSNGQQGGGGKKAASQRKKLPISEAREVILEVELEKMLEAVDLKKEAITAVEESGIVFIDEIDKICTSRDSGSRSADASAEGVQRDLLPLIEGTVISTKYGNVNTDYILFIASGAFHSVKPSDLLPELQGRLPIRVELNGLTEDDLYKILTEPVANLIRQQVELISTEGVTLEFDDDAIREIARMAAMLNKSVENIGARRLHTVMERIMEHLSFEAAEVEKGTVLRVNKSLVTGRLNEVTTKMDLQKYIL